MRHNELVIADTVETTHEVDDKIQSLFSPTVGEPW